MVRIPHDLFRMILSYKDPRYELVCSGGKSPSAHALKRYVFTVPHTEYHAGGGSITWGGPQILVSVRTGESYVVVAKFCVDRAALEFADVDSDVESVLDYELNVDGRLAELSLQCEACGPDLELYK